MFISTHPFSYIIKVKPHYLSVMISDDLLGDNDIKRQIKALYLRGNMLCHRFYHCTPEIKKRLIHTYCANNYGCELWGKYKKAQLKKIVVAFNNIFRQFINIEYGTSMSAAFVNANVDSFTISLDEKVLSLLKRLVEFNTPVLSSDFFPVFYTLACTQLIASVRPSVHPSVRPSVHPSGSLPLYRSHRLS